MAVSVPLQRNSEGEPVNFIFVGTKLSHTKSTDNARSLLMKEHYRRKRLTNPDKSEPSSDHDQRRKRQRGRRKKVTFKYGQNEVQNPTRDPSVDEDIPSGGLHSDTPSSTSPAKASLQTRSARTPPASSRDAVKYRLASFPDLATDQTSPCPSLGIFIDPIAYITGDLDAQSRYHVRRYARLPTALLGIAADAITCMSHDIPMAEQFPILNHAYAAFSSRQMDDSPSQLVHLRNHKALVHIVNAEMARPHEGNYNTILLGIKGALASAYIGGDLVEFETHRRGLTHFIIKHGPPKDPDVLIHLVAGCVVFGKSAIEPTLDMSWTADAASNMYIVNHWLAPSQDLIDLVQLLNSRSCHAAREYMAADRSASQRKLFAPGSILHHAINEPRCKDPTATPWRQLFDTDHHPFLVMYLTLLCLDLETKPRYDQDLAYALIITTIREYRLTRDVGSVMLNYMLLRLHKRDTRRTWRTFQLHHVLLALPEEHQRPILDLFTWFLCLESEPPRVSTADIRLWFRSRIGSRASLC